MVALGVLVTVLCLCTPFSRAGTVLAEEKATCKTEDGKEVKVNEQYNKPGACTANLCKENGEFAVAECAVQAEPPTGWTLSALDPSKGFPDCCPRPLPPLEIVPDVLDHLRATEPWEISYGNNATVNMGNELTPTQVKEQPSVKYTSWADPKSFYLLAMVDPDAPSVQNPEAREFLHWLVGNIPGDDVASGEILAEYVGSGPTQQTGLHRYVFLLYKQPKKLTFDEKKIKKNTAQGRKKFSARKLAEKYKLGNPVSINVYQAEYDDYVPELHRQLGAEATD